MTDKTKYTELTRVHARLHRDHHLSAIIGWDRSAMMPPKGNEALNPTQFRQHLQTRYLPSHTI